MSGKSGKKRKEDYTVAAEDLELLEHYVLAVEISLIQEYFGEEIEAMLTLKEDFSHRKEKTL